MMWVAMVVSCNDVVPYSSPCCKALVAQCSKFFPSVRSSAEACVCPSPLCKIWGPKEHVIPPMKALLYSNSDPQPFILMCMHSSLPPSLCRRLTPQLPSLPWFSCKNWLYACEVMQKVNQTLEWKLQSCQHILSNHPNPEYKPRTKSRT